jgi:hypothetical protein
MHWEEIIWWHHVPRFRWELNNNIIDYGKSTLYMVGETKEYHDTVEVENGFNKGANIVPEHLVADPSTVFEVSLYHVSLCQNHHDRAAPYRKRDLYHEGVLNQNTIRTAIRHIGDF